MPSPSDVDVLDDHPCTLGESPVWDDQRSELLWVDIVERQVHRRTLDGDRWSTDFGEAVGAVALCRSEGWIVALETGVARRSSDGTLEELGSFAGAGGPHAGLRANDGACGPGGRFWIGTMAWDATPRAGSLYCLDPHRGSFTTVLTDVTISNGLGWSPDGTTMYYVDTATAAIDAFAFDAESGEVTGRHHLVEVPEASGAPDGLTVDAEGGIWVALWGGGQVHRYTPDGRFDRAIELPCSQVTSCAFVGESLDQLAITTAHVGLEQPESQAGWTFITDAGVTGLPTNRFAD